MATPPRRRQAASRTAIREVLERAPTVMEPAGAGAGAAARPTASYAPGMDTSRRANSSTDQVMRNWNPGRVAPGRESPWEEQLGKNRVGDLVNNSPWAAGVVDRQQSTIVGGNFRYSARSGAMAKLLDIDKQAASDLATQIERVWGTFANDKLRRCHWSRKLTFGQMAGLAVRHRYTDGDALAVLRWDAETDWAFRTSVQMMDPDRLATPIGMTDGPTMYNGVETNGRFPVAYHFREAHPNDPYAWGKTLRSERIPVRQDWGRPVVIHLHKTQRADEFRGVSPFLPLLRKFKTLDRYTESELQAAAVNALFAGFLKTTASTDEAASMLGLEQLKERVNFESAYYSGLNPTLSDGSRVAKLLPGDEFTLNATPRHVQSYQGFVETTLRAIAAGLPGVAYEQLSMDFSKTNYSSYRGAMQEAWRGVMDERDLVAGDFCDPILLAVLEEGIDDGRITPPKGCPDLYENTAGWLAGRWIGPGRGYVDPVKEVEAAKSRAAAGLSTMEDETIEATGGDYESNVEQLAYERDLFAKAGLTPTPIREMTAQNQPGAAPEDNIDARPGDPPAGDTQE